MAGKAEINVGHAAKECPHFLPGATFAGATPASKVAQGTGKENENLNAKEMKEILHVVDLFY
ncbi:hypothetical protein CHS0354_025982 [Potamilus streckersoni]|uniref:Uncharacterized protein n=1 Tax=Potamilus streckersoni TaxID=2493646 RepID=A0AAE0T511_9BIVA|nr:hypothetical protein CHS0354_025982 [Potamilus streckersoni]